MQPATTSQQSEQAAASASPPKFKRLVSLDAFRGWTTFRIGGGGA